PQLRVEDDGLGMSPSFIDDELFRPFSTTKTENGVGIGAYLTKSYIEHLGALLNVQSKEGQGTRFDITFN
ncbi:HAMP domain-containing sensor histidine kinase, partial [Saccharospirillum sp. MSK14-1]|uniref:sensor histidine kinase n=1 Tax=Saccharospirillum sp. MSK14-1 TaxID=1897632 RepID=UPI0011B23734